MSMLSSSELNRLNEILAERIEEVLEHFGLDARKGKSYVLACPIHGGDNGRACNIYVDNYACFCCQTHHCELVFRKTLIGLIRGILSAKFCEWSSEGDAMYPWNSTIDYIKRMLNLDNKGLAVKSEDVKKKDFVKMVNAINGTKRKDKEGFSFKLPRSVIRERLDIPADFYLKRGYSKEILDKYDIGLCTKTGQPMTDRIVVPIYDHNYEYAIECVGRSIFDECPLCKKHHKPGDKCPADFLPSNAKWRGTPGFDKSLLFNFWFAKDFINKSNVVCLTESPGNVLRLEEAGIHNSVAMFGSDFSDGQSILIEATQALSVLILMDNDEAGQQAAERIKRKLKRMYDVHVHFPSANDWGELSPQQTLAELTPVLQGIYKKYERLHN